MLIDAIQFSQEFDQPLGVTSESKLVLAIVVLRVAVWVLGTIATIVFIFKGHKSDGSNDA